MTKTPVDYKVVAHVVSEVTYTVPAISAEEAEVIAEAYLEEGEAPQDAIILDVVIQDSYPVEEVALGEQVRYDRGYQQPVDDEDEQ